MVGARRLTDFDDVVGDTDRLLERLG